jgi:hypothetical protein
MDVLDQVPSIDGSLELAEFFGVFLRHLIGETVCLVAGCCGQWCIVHICWHAV